MLHNIPAQQIWMPRNLFDTEYQVFQLIQIILPIFCSTILGTTALANPTPEKKFTCINFWSTDMSVSKNDDREDIRIDGSVGDEDEGVIDVECDKSNLPSMTKGRRLARISAGMRLQSRTRNKASWTHWNSFWLSTTLSEDEEEAVKPEDK